MLEQTFLLEKIEKDYPHIFADISDLIKANKIEIAGGQYLLADNMVPNGEVLIREITEGKKSGRVNEPSNRRGTVKKSDLCRNSRCTSRLPVVKSSGTSRDSQPLELLTYVGTSDAGK